MASSYPRRLPAPRPPVPPSSYMSPAAIRRYQTAQATPYVTRQPAPKKPRVGKTNANPATPLAPSVTIDPGATPTYAPGVDPNANPNASQGDPGASYYAPGEPVFGQFIGGGPSGSSQYDTSLWNAYAIPGANYIADAYWAPGGYGGGGASGWEAFGKGGTFAGTNYADYAKQNPQFATGLYQYVLDRLKKIQAGQTP